MLKRQIVQTVKLTDGQATQVDQLIDSHPKANAHLVMRALVARGLETVTADDIRRDAEAGRARRSVGVQPSDGASAQATEKAAAERPGKASQKPAEVAPAPEPVPAPTTAPEGRQKPRKFSPVLPADPGGDDSIDLGELMTEAPTEVAQMPTTSLAALEELDRVSASQGSGDVMVDLAGMFENF